jgi:hypothetical protein
VRKLTVGDDDVDDTFFLLDEPFDVFKLLLLLLLPSFDVLFVVSVVSSLLLLLLLGETTFHIARSIEKLSGHGVNLTKLYITASNGKVSESF